MIKQRYPSTIVRNNDKIIPVVVVVASVVVVVASVVVAMETNKYDINAYAQQFSGRLDVQSIVSLTTSLRRQLVKFMLTTNVKYTINCVEKCKADIFQQKLVEYL